MDIDFLRRLHKKVNVVLVIAKADALTTSELKKLKSNILSDLETHNIELYQFPECDSDEDEDFKQQDRELKASIPFAVVCSNSLVEVGGRKVNKQIHYQINEAIFHFDSAILEEKTEF